MPRRKTAGVSPGKLAVGNAPRSHAELPCYTGVQSVAAKEDLLLRGCGLAPRRKNCETNDGERKDGSQTEPNLRYLHKKFKKMAEAVGAEAGGGAVESNGGGGGGGGAEVRGGAVAPVAMEAPSADTSPVEASPPPPASPPSTSNDASSSSSSSSSEESKRRAAAATPGAAAATGGGRHICPYCKLACAKPSVLQKHVRAHTNERPYPCRTCGFAFKTKSNLYKHCRSRSHALKAERPSSAAAVPGAEDDEEDEEEVSNGVSGEEEEEEGVEDDESPREESGSGGYGGTGKTSPMEDQECQSVAASLANSRPRTIYKPKFHTAALYRDEEEQQQQSQQCRAMAEGALGGGPSAPMSSEREAPPSQPPPPAASAPSQEYLRRHVARIIDENRAIVEGGDRSAWAKKRVWGGQRAPAVANSRPGAAPSPHTDSPPPPRPSDPGPESRLALALLRPAPEQPLNLSRAGPDRARWDPSRAPLRKESPSPSPLQPTLPKTCPLCRAQFRDEESLEAHRMCYCEGRGPPSYARKASGAEAEDVGHMMGACLPSPGPLLGNTPLVDGYNPPGIPAPKVGPPPKKRRTDPQPSPRSIRHSAPEYEGPSSVLRGGVEDAREQSPSAMLPAARPANAVHLFGGEVRIREGSETKTLRIEVGGRGGANREVLRGEEGGGGTGAAGGAGRDGDTVVTIARSGLHSGGTIVHVRKTSSCEEDAPTVRRPKAKAGGRRSLAPSPTGESSPPASLSLPIAPQISTPDLAPDLRAPFGPFAHHDGVLLGYDHPPPSPSLRARPSPPRPSPSSSGVLTIFHGGRAVPFVPGMPGPQGTPPLLVLPARTPLDLGPPLPEGKDHSPHPNHVFAAEASREATPPPPRQQPPPPPPPPPPPRVSPVPPQASPTPTRAENDSTAPEDQKKKSRFLRPTSLPLKPGTYPLKKHSQGNTPLGIGSSGASLVSPETPRPRKSYGQLYLNGHAYTYLGLKCSTRPSFCCAHRRPPQPMYVAQGPAHPRLSMYSNWKVCEAVTAEPFGLEPGKAMRLYDSRHRPSDTSVAPSQTDGSNAMILTHSSYWLLKKERDVLGEKEETVEVKEEAVDMEEKMDKENGKPAATSVKSERQKESEQQCTKSSADAEGQSQPPARVKIFAGGFESNEEYIYVRGRGRGRYVCEECGIRCKKPSMLKKHIRTHTDVRPFTCRHCCFRNGAHFSFKTKGNLTKHMKSKAHFKKCVEMGIVPVPTTVDESHIDEESLAKQQAQRAASLAEGESESDDDDDEEDDEEEEEDEEDEEDNADGADSSKGKMEQEEREVARSLLSLSESIDPTNGIGRLPPPPPPPEPVSSYAPQSGLTPLLSRPRSYPYLSHLPDQSISPPLPAEEKARVLPLESDVTNPESHIFPSSSSSTMVAVASGQRYYFPSRRDAQAQEKMTEESVNAVKTPTPLRLSVRDASPSAGTPVFNATNIDPADQDANEMEDGVNGGSYGPVDLSTGGGAGGSLPSTPEDRGPRLGWRVRGQEREEAIRARNAGQPAFILASVLPHSPYGTLPGTPTTPVREHPSEILAPVPSDSAALLASLCSTVNKLPQSTLDASSGGGSVATTPTMDDNTPGGGTMLQAYLTERALQDVRLKRQQRSPFHPLGREDQVEPVPMTGTCNVITSVGPSAISLPPGVVSKVVSMTHSPRIVDSPSYEVGKAAEAIQEVQVKVCETIPRKDWSETERENGEVNVYCASTASTVARVIERPCVVSSNHSSASPALRQAKTTADAHSAGESNSITPVGSSEMMKLSHVVGPRVPSCSPKAEFMPPLSGPSSSYTGVTEDGRSMCAICHKVFSKASQLRLHVNIHYFERPFRCDSCAVSFRTRGHLQKHQRSVSHQNKVSMNSTFGMPTTENPRPFKCGDCKIAFRIHGHLAKHLRSKMHIMRLECVGKLPFGTYAEVERSGISLADIDTSDCENSLESLQMLAQKLYEKDPTKLQHWERTRALSESSEDEGMGYHRDESGHGIPVPNGPLHGGTLMRPSVLEQTASRRAFCGTLTSDYEDASDGESHLMLQPQLTRSFICDFCDAGFTSKQLLQNHLLVHQQSPPDNCL